MRLAKARCFCCWQEAATVRDGGVVAWSRRGGRARGGSNRGEEGEGEEGEEEELAEEERAEEEELVVLAPPQRH